jgi:hypothetical protein
LKIKLSRAFVWMCQLVRRDRVKGRACRLIGITKDYETVEEKNNIEALIKLEVKIETGEDGISGQSTVIKS